MKVKPKTFCKASSNHHQIIMEQFDHTLLTDYIKGFWGYGTFSTDYWFVGMEEGGGDNFNEVKQRLLQWDKRGRKPLEDLYEYHRDIKVHKWFQMNAPLQPTWNRLIRVLLVTKSEFPDKEIVRKYQIEKLGRSNGEVCLLELLPLPSPSTSHWMYSEHSDNQILSTRKQYTQAIGEIRAEKLSKLISEHQPRIVMFYGIGYLDWWRNVTQTELTPKMLHNKIAYFGKLKNTAIAISQHPVATGVSLNYFHEIGQQLSEM